MTKQEIQIYQDAIELEKHPSNTFLKENIQNEVTNKGLKYFTEYVRPSLENLKTWSLVPTISVLIR